MLLVPPEKHCAVCRKFVDAHTNKKLGGIRDTLPLAGQQPELENEVKRLRGLCCEAIN